MDIIKPAIPEGLRDIMPAEAGELRVLEKSLKNIFAGWSYGEVITPAFEFFRTLSTDAGDSIKNEMFRFFDGDGIQLALRPEMTIPIARLTSQRLKDVPGPHRLYYFSNVFRKEPSLMGQRREFFQAGTELIGAGGSVADAEVLAILIEALLDCGLDDFQVGIGQMALLRSIFGSLNINRSLQKKLEAAGSKGDLVSFKRLLFDSGADQGAKDLIEYVISLRGGPEVFDQLGTLTLSRESRSEIDELRSTIDILIEIGLGKRIIIDLGLIRDFDYYTGIIFEAYTPRLGLPLGGGGRYDNLLSDFGYPVPAAGFAVGIERLHLAVSDHFRPGSGKKRLLIYSDDPKKAMVKAAVLRRENRICEIFLRPGDKASARDYAEAKNFDEIIEV